MKYSTTINHVGISDAGLNQDTNFQDWVLLDYIFLWQNHSKGFLLDGHVWVDYKHVFKEIGMLSVSTKGGLSKIFTRLKQLGLLTSICDDNGRAYFRITDLYLSIVGFRTDATPFPQGNTPVSSGKHPVSSGKHIISNNIINNKTKLSASEEDSKNLAEQEKQQERQLTDEGVVFSSVGEWTQYFISEKEFPRHMVQTPKAMALFSQWVDDGVCVGDMVLAMDACHVWKGERADSPVLYGKFLQSLFSERNKLADSRQSKHKNIKIEQRSSSHEDQSFAERYPQFNHTVQ